MTSSKVTFSMLLAVGLINAINADFSFILTTGSTVYQSCNCDITPSVSPPGLLGSVDVLWKNVDVKIIGSDYTLGGQYLPGEFEILAKFTDLSFYNTRAFYNALTNTVTHIEIYPLASAVVFAVINSQYDLEDEIDYLNSNFIEWLGESGNNEALGNDIADYAENDLASANVPLSLFFHVFLCGVTGECIHS